MTNEELKHLALNMLCTNYITPRDMELALARGAIRVIIENENMIGVVEACRDMWIELSDDERKEWDPQWLQKYDALSAALDKLGGRK